MRYAGMDPDLKNVSIAILDSEGLLDELVLFKAPYKMKGLDCVLELYKQIGSLAEKYPWPDEEETALVIEAQDIRYTGKTNKARPQDLIKLATMTGAMGALGTLLGFSRLEFVMPQAWKGSVPKEIHQRRICKKMGWEAIGGGLPTPKTDVMATVFSGNNVVIRELKKTEWKHVLDSIGLALYLKDSYTKLTSKIKRGRVEL